MPNVGLESMTLRSRATGSTPIQPGTPKMSTDGRLEFLRPEKRGQGRRPLTPWVGFFSLSSMESWPGSTLQKSPLSRDRLSVPHATSVDFQSAWRILPLSLGAAFTLIRASPAQPRLVRAQGGRSLSPRPSLGLARAQSERSGSRGRGRLSFPRWKPSRPFCRPLHTDVSQRQPATPRS